MQPSDEACPDEVRAVLDEMDRERLEAMRCEMCGEPHGCQCLGWISDEEEAQERRGNERLINQGY